MPDVHNAARESKLTVSLNPAAARGSADGLVLGVFSFRHDAHLVPGLVENIRPMVDGWVAYDDRSSDSPFGDERLRRKALLDAAVAQGARWILALDPAERIESALAGRIRNLIQADGLVAYETAAGTGSEPGGCSRSARASSMAAPASRTTGIPAEPPIGSSGRI